MVTRANNYNLWAKTLRLSTDIDQLREACVTAGHTPICLLLIGVQSKMAEVECSLYKLRAERKRVSYRKKRLGAT